MKWNSSIYSGLVCRFCCRAFWPNKELNLVNASLSWIRVGGVLILFTFIVDVSVVIYGAQS